MPSAPLPRLLARLAAGALIVASMAALPTPAHAKPRAASGAQTTATRVAYAQPASAFVARSGQNLLLGGQSYRMLGYNVWQANIATPQPNTDYALNTGTQLDSTLKAMSGSANTIRSWFFQQYVNTSTGYDWSAFDKTLAVAKANNIKIIATLADQWTFGGTSFRDFAFYNGGYKATVGQRERVTYRQYVQDVVARYKNDPTIAMWELVNEPEAFTDATESSCPSNAAAVMTSFASDVAGLVRAVDPNHLVSLGAGGTGSCGMNEAEYQQVMSVPQLDICSFHDYYGAGNAAAYETYNGLNVRVRQCAALNKPIVIGEVGVGSGGIGLQQRAAAFDAKYKTQFGMQGVVGMVAWQFDVRGSGSDDYVIGANDPVIGVTRSYLK